MPTFDGDPVEYCTFTRAFESLIESRTQSSHERLYYLEQYTAGNVKELIRSCHHLPFDEGYQEARRLLKKKYGDEYRIVCAYESKALAWPSIKPEDGQALNKFSIFLSSCQNALATSQFAFQFHQPGSIQKLVLKLPFYTRERWRRRADDIMEVLCRPVLFSDFVAFVDSEARIVSNPVFGNITGSSHPQHDHKPRRSSQSFPSSKRLKPKSASFATQVQRGSPQSADQFPGGDHVNSAASFISCPYCQKDHALIS